MSSIRLVRLGGEWENKSINCNKPKTSVVFLEKRNASSNESGEKLETKAYLSVEPDINISVAVITSKMTASAGEDIAIVFKNRGNVIFIGEKSYGFLTANDYQKEK